MPTINSRLYTAISVFEGDVIPFFSALNTGDAGTLYKIVTGSANPQNPMGFAAGSSVGYNYSAAGSYIFNQKYETKFKVIPTASGDTAYQAIGFSQWATKNTDLNGNILAHNDRRAKEIGAVRSGEAIPLITKATIFGLWGKEIDQSMGNVQPGNLLVVSRSGDGRFAVVDPTDATKFNTGSSSFIYTPAHVVGKVLTSLPTSSNTGIANEFASVGGYALFTFNVLK